MWKFNPFTRKLDWVGSGVAVVVSAFLRFTESGNTRVTEASNTRIQESG